MKTFLFFSYTDAKLYVFQELGKALKQFQLHMFVQTFTFIFFPISIFTLLTFLTVGPFDEAIVEGYVKHNIFTVKQSQISSEALSWITSLS